MSSTEVADGGDIIELQTKDKKMSPGEFGGPAYRGLKAARVPGMYVCGAVEEEWK